MPYHGAVVEEIELKLAITPGAAARLACMPVLGKVERVAHLSATYYDTPSRALHKAGISLRVRSEDGALVQTIKQDDGTNGPTPGAALFRRGEWTIALETAEPVLDGRTRVPTVLDKGGEALLPRFTVTVRRELRELPLPDHGRAEAAIDVGTVKVGGRSEHFAEIELELRRGDAAALFALARRIGSIVPVRIGVETKAERGWKLLDAMRDAETARVPLLDPAMSVGAAFGAIALACLAAYRGNEDILLARPSPKAVHQARVALRRLRAAIRAFRSILPGPETTRFDRALRALAVALGKVRDLDVMTDHAPAGELRQHMAAAHEIAWQRLRRRLGARQCRMLMLDLAEWIECGPWRSDPATLNAREACIVPFAADSLDRLADRVRRHGRHMAELDEEARHRLRKNAKALRYNAEAFASLFHGHGRKRRIKRFFAAIADLQDDLGLLNDIRIACAWLEGEGLQHSAQARDWIGAMHKKHLLAHAGKARRAMLDIDPFWR